MSIKKTAVILINVGTPDAPTPKAVKQYLSEFLNDKRVIDLPWLIRKILVNLIIIPFRTKKSTTLYQRLWTEQGAPLLFYSNSVAQKLQHKLGNTYVIYNTMRYGSPSLQKTLKELDTKSYKEIIAIPLYPQYANATTGSAIAMLYKEIKSNKNFEKLKIINQFYDHPAFIKAFIKRINQFNLKHYDHIIFSFHGLPLRQIDQSHPGIKNGGCTCDQKMPTHGNHCYKATCYETARLLAKELRLEESNYSICFQSRLSRNWLKPFTDSVIINKAKEGNKRLLVLAPAFVTDCLETTIEIAQEYKQTFLNAGGHQLDLVPGLNDSEEWVAALKEIISS